MKQMKSSRLTLERLLAQLRSEGIRHLGEVKRLYFEANGSFSLVREENPYPGLTVLPAFDESFLNQQPQGDYAVCRTCGTKGGDAPAAGAGCPNCGDGKWVPAIV
jgi:hypothetical protein